MTVEKYQAMHGIAKPIHYPSAPVDNNTAIKESYTNALMSLRNILLAHDTKHSSEVIVSKAPALALLDELMSYSSYLVDPSARPLLRPLETSQIIDLRIARETIDRILRNSSNYSSTLVSADEAMNLDTLFNEAYPV